jgi:hypothetical protein
MRHGHNVCVSPTRSLVQVFFLDPGFLDILELKFFRYNVVGHLRQCDGFSMSNAITRPIAIRYHGRMLVNNRSNQLTSTNTPQIKLADTAHSVPSPLDPKKYHAAFPAQCKIGATYQALYHIPRPNHPELTPHQIGKHASASQTTSPSSA